MANKKPTKRKLTKQTTKRRSPAPPKIAVTRNPAPARATATAAAPARSGRIITTDQIAKRAYEIWQKQGGSELENWLRAERELRGA